MNISNRLRKPKDPCQVCFLNKVRCICEHLFLLKLKTKITLVIHAKELKRTTNTGRLALAVLTNSQMRVRGVGTETLDLSDLLDSHYHPLIFYPSLEATELTAELMKEIDRPINLIVPDGSWRQASKVHYRHHELKDVMRVKISSPNLAKEHLRTENTDYGMATMEAIACALGIIEGPEVKQTLMQVFQRKLEQTILGRGLKIEKQLR